MVPICREQCKCVRFLFILSEEKNSEKEKKGYLQNGEYGKSEIKKSKKNKRLDKKVASKCRFCSPKKNREIIYKRKKKEKKGNKKE